MRPITIHKFLQLMDNKCGLEQIHLKLKILLITCVIMQITNIFFLLQKLMQFFYERLWAVEHNFALDISIEIKRKILLVVF